jgi:hypothetical protein
MEMVNGYVCLNCSDVAKAKRGIDPAANPLQAAQGKNKSGAANTKDLGAKELAAKDTLGVNQPLAAGLRGTQVNVLL